MAGAAAGGDEELTQDVRCRNDKHEQHEHDAGRFRAAAGCLWRRSHALADGRARRCRAAGRARCQGAPAAGRGRSPRSRCWSVRRCPRSPPRRRWPTASWPRRSARRASSSSLARRRRQLGGAQGVAEVGLEAAAPCGTELRAAGLLAASLAAGVLIGLSNLPQSVVPALADLAASGSTAAATTWLTSIRSMRTCYDGRDDEASKADVSALDGRRAGRVAGAQPGRDRRRGELPVASSLRAGCCGRPSYRAQSAGLHEHAAA